MGDLGGLNRGYTGHEHLDAFGIINMNGRVYDPTTAMFFSPDPFISSPGDWLNYNRYGYVLNNPMRYTDPSGYSQREGEHPGIVNSGNNDFNDKYIDYVMNGGNPGTFFFTQRFGRGDISYNWSSGTYQYANGEEVDYPYVKENYIDRNASVQATGIKNVIFSGTGENITFRGFLFNNGKEWYTEDGLDALNKFSLYNHSKAINNWFAYTLEFAGTGYLVNSMKSYFNTLQKTSNANSLGLNYSKELGIVGKISKWIKVGGVLTAFFSVGFSVNDYKTNRISKDKMNLDIFMTGYSFVPPVGTFAGLQYYIIDNTIGIEKFMNYTINSEIEKNKAVNNGNYAMFFYPHFGQSYR